uniref:Uncharacterized protein n=1 Tax=Dunaliella tertiolecta TaxID=3047 RepID=A0A6S8HXX0_DUNTE|mmetsp:Transcript_556/g.1455  ORF Transcript_556/g.1455 Transcript_556/m.1455 type:complete len:384 (+) Transcript_556:1774-2925(+)|eukprot:CAMPEP_0202404714 /NCGR_PEP_ID=MMETSP1128-20130828/5872_1 /ASSEMBLY_ACC=CAM_ASM_000463 /TAXON_ID=3047 /ORGANISM="Dunaliella tertiolecta, Strain CCMP1320" /LENGTH=383 /DNA_ID=CAMNT_0049009247 /DNA_START=1748 /DNA_END=2899 /DNA_ORIENTATION=-
MSLEEACSSRASSTEEEPGNDACPESEAVLATLSALGVPMQLRMRVQEAIVQLEQLSHNTNNMGELAPAPASTQPGSKPGVQPKGAASGSKPGAAPKVQTVEAKLQMSRSIMRKLHHKNVALEKELQMYKANANPITFSQPTSEMLEQLSSRSSTSMNLGDRPGKLVVANALQERDEAILQLRHALDASRRSNALLEGQLAAAAAASPPNGHDARSKRGAAGIKQPSRFQPQGNAVSQESQMNASRYKQIRNDYNHLLRKRAGYSQASKALPGTPQAMLMELKARLTKEMSERDAEAALYSTRLYESERHLSDWYVEKRMLEEHITKLNSEIVERDNLDQQIQSCVCGLFERVHLLETENAELQRRLEAVQQLPGNQHPAAGD